MSWSSTMATFLWTVRKSAIFYEDGYLKNPGAESEDMVQWRLIDEVEGCVFQRHRLQRYRAHPADQ